ncbi:MAG: phospho-N-acetylmuramoyl-pentapeptide-transferase [Chitinophagaceae bacterium]|jgi:phospho-N-acetylmuramoyl-pentapeptide-transferase|nr:phospho-N-acetylmuramoyl-pentapeptide-transferase [Chitinophagaceae bacterium]MCA6478040.1 phospho-N-acetylmuramoyl-pentapeptide-transferase [Chitinophagaceae bacterium]MCA6479319.1 phospho-N-acetylmuramoyl-pentapeptide-transferase [Chitinophagaceae bacterium]MCA6484832.1 phospho-N-acetylmuramoyl-pentapeptide-transferase [Chitinophagaceae bacterium]MCA6487998.1 phospho-N-acetylmuramoyl-pentapeptide-transferase [Chitinophagaceae bacterium]
MLYHLFSWLSKTFHLPGAGLFQFLTFRIAMAVVLSLLIATIYGKKIIEFLRRRQIGETVRDLGLEGQMQKKGTPTMGGIIILLSILIPTLLFANLDKLYIRLMILCTVWLGFIGFLDDYFKIKARQRAQAAGEKFVKKDSDGLAGISKIIGQIGLGIIIGVSLYFSNAVTVEREVITTPTAQLQKGEQLAKDSNVIVRKLNGVEKRFVKVKTPITTIPFVKNHQFNYSKLISWIGPGAEKYTWIIYILIVTFIITAVSNGANLTDGLDGLAAGVSAIIGAGIGVFVYVSGNYILADYFDVMYIPNLGELSIFVGAFVGACIGFLWYNAFPAQVFMGDTGSLALGGIIASLAIIVRKELLIPIFCGVFLVENLSVILQVSYFRYTKKKYGEGRRIFLMSPLHHHYQKKGYHESKIAVRFWIITIICVVLSIVTLKIR